MSAAAVTVDEIIVVGPAPRPRWVFLVKGVLWLVGAIVILSFTSASVTVIAVMAGIAMILAGCDEMADGAMAGSSWRWAHALLGVLFLVTGFLSLLVPFRTFGILALFIGWYLMLKGTFDIAIAIALRHDRPLWGVTLALGVGQILIGFWALGYPSRSAWLLIAWVGFAALARGIGDLVQGFAGRPR